MGLRDHGTTRRQDYETTGSPAIHFSPSHSSRETPACLSNRLRNPGPISPSCSLGIIKVKSPRFIWGCLPPEKGPSKPSSRSRWMNLRRETGATLGMSDGVDLVGIRLCQLGSPKSGPEPKSHPIAQGFAEFARPPGDILVSRPHPLQPRNLA